MTRTEADLTTCTVKRRIDAAETSRTGFRKTSGVTMRNLNVVGETGNRSEHGRRTRFRAAATAGLSRKETSRIYTRENRRIVASAV